MDNPVIFILNGKEVRTFSNPGTVLLDFIRKELFLTGTKEGCREGDCGACTVLIGENSRDFTCYRAQNSCLIPLGSVHGKHVVTIEGINLNALSPLQEALIGEGAIQCGFCTAGLIMSITGFLLSGRQLSTENAIDAIAGNICRCTGYNSIKRAVEHFLSESEISPEAGRVRMESLVKKGLIPHYFLEVPERLKNIPQTKNTKAEGAVVAGGTDIMLQKRHEIPDIKLNFLSKDIEDAVRLENDFLILDAGLTVTDLMNSVVLRNYFPQIKDYLKLFGSHQIRNRASLGGNIVNASPAADMVNILLALDSTLVIKNKEVREVALKDFYLAYKSLDKKEDELVIEVKLPVPEAGYFFNYEKVSRRTHLDIASVNSSIYMKTESGFIKSVHISAGGVAPIPLYLKETAAFLRGKVITFETIHNAALIAGGEISPISDIRGSSEYKRLLLRQLIFAHFQKFSPALIESPEMLFT